MKKFTIILFLMGSNAGIANEFCDQGFKLRCLLDSSAQDNPICIFAGRCSQEEQARYPNLEHKIVTLITQRQMEQLNRNFEKNNEGNKF